MNYIAKLRADIALIQSQMEQKGTVAKALIDEIVSLSLSRDYLTACLEEALATQNTNVSSVTSESNNTEPEENQ